MSLRPDPIGPIPADTARVARAAFPKGHPCLRLRDTLGTIYEDTRFAALFPEQGRSTAPGAEQATRSERCVRTKW